MAKAKKAAKKAAPKAVKQPKKVAAPKAVIASKQTKTEIVRDLAEASELTNKQVNQLLLALRDQLERHLKPRGSGEMVIPGVGIKVRRIMKKATKARKGRNPFTGEEIMIAAKPARKAVKVTAMKSLKEVV